MSTIHPDSERLGAYVLGMLESDEQIAVEQHSDTCETCRADLGELREVEATLGEVPPEMFLEGPPDDGELLLQRTLRRVRSENIARNRRRSLATGITIAASTAVALFGVNIWVNGMHSSNQAISPGASRPQATATADPSVKVASARDVSRGTSLTVDATPAHAWVRLHAVVEGLPTDKHCRLVVLSKDGQEQIAGNWVVPAPPSGEETVSTSLNGSASIPLEQIKALVVESVEGERFISVSF
ncbi:zf-HC2 domain-containing protein [Streptomyces sp. NPDC048489]|uniref:zf-HC2 domain-containing protein n=1 Tax=Streptomyces sp. NPDC048489 TaxID=3154504 RepID=UPI0034317A71